MNVARILYPVKVLGPGNRVGIWLCGCKRACKGCSNPELWNHKEEYEISVDRLLELIKRLATDHTIDGFTISGGEPLDQASELLDLLKKLHDISEDILVYTGYTREEFTATNSLANDILPYIAVLVDGPYIEEKNAGLVLRGSTNQRIHILKEKYRGLYDWYLRENGNRIQNFTTTDGIVSVGIHKPGFTPYRG